MTTMTSESIWFQNSMQFSLSTGYLASGHIGLIDSTFLENVRLLLLLSVLDRAVFGSFEPDFCSTFSSDHIRFT